MMQLDFTKKCKLHDNPNLQNKNGRSFASGIVKFPVYAHPVQDLACSCCVPYQRKDADRGITDLKGCFI